MGRKRWGEDRTVSQGEKAVSGERTLGREENGYEFRTTAIRDNTL